VEGAVKSYVFEVVIDEDQFEDGRVIPLTAPRSMGRIRGEKPKNTLSSEFAKR
jgi:hypothetical protein